VSEQLPSTTTQITGESVLAEEAGAVPEEKASVRSESPEMGLIQTARCQSYRTKFVITNDPIINIKPICRKIA